MKRTMVVVAALVLASAVGFAQTTPKAGQRAQANNGPRFVDANGDGICDNVGTGGGGRWGRGAGRGMGAGQGAGAFGSGMGGRGGRGFAFGRNGGSLVAVTARVTGLPEADVLTALRGGKTFEQVAADHGKSAHDLVSTALAARQSALQAAVKDGRLTNEQADQMLARAKAMLEQHVSSPWQPRGRGFGRR